MNQKETTPMQVTYHLPSFFPPLMGPLKPFFWSQRYFQRTRRWTKRKGGEGGWNFKIYDINVHINKYIIWCIYIYNRYRIFVLYTCNFTWIFVCLLASKDVADSCDESVYHIYFGNSALAVFYVSPWGSKELPMVHLFRECTGTLFSSFNAKQTMEAIIDAPVALASNLRIFRLCINIFGGPDFL